MDHIDYSVGVRKLSNQLLRSHDGVDITNSKMLFDYYKSLFMMRHNILHYFCLDMLNLPWEYEQKIKDRLEIPVPQEFANKTPDIFLRNKNGIVIIDVSISYDLHKTEKTKFLKYKPIVDWLCEIGLPARYHHVNVYADNSNIETEVCKIKYLSDKDFNYLDYFRLMSIIEDKKEFVNKNIDKEFFENQKIIEFNRKEKIKDSFFLDEMRYANLGNYNDLEIDLEVFKDYNKKFKHMKPIKETISTFDEENLVKKLGIILEGNNPVYVKYQDEKLMDSQFKEAAKEIYTQNENTQKHTPKPTHHLLLPIRGEESGIIDGDYNEQLSILSFFRDYQDHFDTFSVDDKNEKLLFLRDFSKEFLFCFDESKDKTINNNLYNDRGDYLSDLKKDYKTKKLKSFFISEFKRKGKISANLALKMELPCNRKNKEELTKLYQKYLMDEKLDMNMSFRKYLKNKEILKEEDNCSYVKQNKIIRINRSTFSEEAKNCYRDTGINVDLNLRKRIKIKERTTVSYEHTVNVDKFLEILIDENKECKNYKENDFLCSKKFGVDSPEANKWKSESVDKYVPYLELLQRTNCYQYSLNNHYCYKQLLHATQYNTGESTFYVYNSGIKNLMIIVALSYTKTTNDDGKPFMSIIKTKYPKEYTNFFGKIYQTKIPNSEYWYVYTNWRRLSLAKITYMYDSHFSVLSSTMNTIMSAPQVPVYLLNKKIEKIYSLRTMIAYATNQKIGELLMDTRYAYMSAFSVYTNIQKLLVEKFGSTHNNILEVWIVKRLLDRLPLINKKALTDGIIQNRIEMDDNTRDINTIGGVINLPSLWNDYMMKDITELLDEAFIYVHTMKEPANIFHENVKAIKTIVQFQKEYDSLPEYIQSGSVNDNNLEDYLLYDTKIGCSSSIIYNSVKHTLSREKPFFRKIISDINNETIGELISTKAVIKDTEREVVEDEKPNKREIEKKILRQEQLENRILDNHEKENMKMYYLTTTTGFYNPRKLRQKVMETVLEYIEKENTISKTTHLANYFIKEEGGNVLADICIKAQYGAKREFYVVNLGAKSLARLTEVFFKKLSFNSPNEAISIPGDDKIIAMQKMLDRIYFNPITPKHKVMYVNGDCTKWSAAETMASFLSMTYALKPHLTTKMYNVLKATFNAWSDKKIQIPMDIFNKVIPREDLGTGFLRELQRENITFLKSTQNFLQGMFNYASSYKAVCCINYTIYLWQKIYPKSTLMVEHMEHSDDYVLIILYENKSELEKFRVLQKIIMRAHGYNDSDRKTSCQPFLLEFVSQMSFNGVMLYPQIKKSKEVNLSLPCVGYKQDIEAALSRVGECARVGCNQSYLYFFQRLHMYRVADAYSILPGGANSYSRTYQDLFNDPIELFGVPDVLPLFSLYCRGNGNNYRLYKYGDNKLKYCMRNLYLISKDNLNREDTLIENHEYEYSLQSPRFLYEVYNKTMQKFRFHLDITPEEVAKFWENNLTYKLLKPRHCEKLIPWIKCMYYNRTFLEAYTKVNRTMMTMRLSRFVKNKIVKPYMCYSDYSDSPNIVEKRAMTMKDYYFEIKDMVSPKVKLVLADENMLNKIITKCDPTYGIIYSILERIQIVGIKKEKTRSVQVAIRTPNKLKTINIINSPGVLLQYMYNKDNFMADNRVLISREALEKDLTELKNRIPKEQLENKTTMGLLSIYNDLMISKERSIVMFGYNRHTKLLLDSVIDIYSNNFLPGYVLNIYMTNVLTVRDPVNNDILYTKGERLTKDFYRQCIDNICLIYVWLKKYCCYDHSKIKTIMEKILFRLETIGTIDHLNYIKILKMVSQDHMKQYNYTLDDKKIVAYLKVIFLNDYESLDELTNTVYSFTYKYIIMDKLYAGEYRGKTLVNYTYFNTSIEAYYERDFFKMPILLVNKYYQSVENILYNIALRLTGHLNQYEFEKTINYNRIVPLKMSELNNHSDFFNKYDVRWVVKYYGDQNKLVKISNIKENDYILPIFKTNKKIQRLGEKHLDIGKIRPNLNESSLSVHLGKSKIYTLPFWKCEQYDNMSVIKGISIDDVPLSEYLSQERLKKFLMMKQYLSNPDLDYLSQEKLIEKITIDIKRHKLYEYDLSNLVVDCSPDILSLLKNEPICKRLNMDKKIIEANLLLPKGINFDDYFSKNIETKIEEPVIPFVEKSEKERLMDILPLSLMEEISYTETDDIESFNMGEFLNDTAMSFNFEDDFLVELDDVDIIPIEEEMEYHQPTYYGKELQNVYSGIDYVSDVFIIDPRKKRFTKKATENQGYLVKRIENLRSFYLLSYKEKMDISKLPSYLTYANFVENLKNCINLIQYLKEKNDSLIEVFFCLEKLLCNTYITRNKIKDKKDFVLEDNLLKPCIWIPNKYNDIQLRKIVDKIKNYTDKELLVEVPMEIYMDRFNDDRKKGIEQTQNIYVSLVYDDYIIKKTIEMLNENRGYEDIDAFLFE